MIGERPVGAAVLPLAEAASLPVVPNHWYVLAPACRIVTEPLIVVLAGQTVHVWRDAAGEVRTAPEAWSVRVADGYVWAFVGPDAPTSDPGVPKALSARIRSLRRTIAMPADYRLVLENSLDFAHSAFIHAWTQPSWAMHRLPRLKPLTATYRSTETGLSVRTRWGPLVVFDHEFLVPDCLRLIVLPEGPLPMDVVVHHVPATADSCRMEVLVRRKALPWEAEHDVWRPDDLLLHRQDRLILAAQQRLVSGDWQEQHCVADAYTLLMRRVLAAAMAGEPWQQLVETPRDIQIAW